MRTHVSSVALTIGLLAIGCGDDDSGSVTAEPGNPFGNYEDMNISVIGAPDGDPDLMSDDSSEDDGAASPDAPIGNPVLVGTPPPGDEFAETEICVSDGLCEVPPVDSSGWCERDGGPVDLIYVDGELVETICYPPADDPDRPIETVDGNTSGDINILQMANRTVVVIDESTNGTPIEGDLSVDGNNVSIYGNGPDNTILDGDVNLDGNGVRLRGVTITGDLIIRKNRAAVVLTRVLGNVHLETMSTNGSVFAENDIFGDFISDSNGNLFVGNDVLGEWSHSGNGNVCDGNASFIDDDEDELVDDEERDETLTCSDGGG